MKTHPRAATGLQVPFSLLALSLLLVLSRLQLTASQSVQRDKMICPPRIPCNDFTQAGSLVNIVRGDIPHCDTGHESHGTLQRLHAGWFLHTPKQRLGQLGGVLGLCYNRESCNRRFFVRSVRFLSCDFECILHKTW